MDAFDEGKILYDPECILKDLRDKLFKELEAKGVIKTDLYWQWPIKHFGDKIEF
ncbi:MAG: Nucleotidyltransferase domain protein [Promethearchaeota archaeon]|nr:MAG: Nucleotidyltransferase domain protein [Candidatus Lokiarchaeota archaeon]